MNGNKGKNNYNQIIIIIIGKKGICETPNLRWRDFQSRYNKSICFFSRNFPFRVFFRFRILVLPNGIESIGFVMCVNDQLMENSYICHQCNIHHSILEVTQNMKNYGFFPSNEEKNILIELSKLMKNSRFTHSNAFSFVNCRRQIFFFRFLVCSISISFQKVKLS